MALPVSGPISFNAINTELGFAAGAQASINSAAYRGLAGVASGTIDLQDFYGKSNVQPLVVTLNTFDLSGTFNAPSAGGWDVYTDGAASVSVSGGVGPYTYSWIRQVDSPPNPVPTNPTSSSTSFYVNLYTSFEGDIQVTQNTFYCRVTDSGARTADSGLFEVTLTVIQGQI